MLKVWWRWPSSVTTTLAFIKCDNEPPDRNEAQADRLQRLFNSLVRPTHCIPLRRHEAFIQHTGSVHMVLTLHGDPTAVTGFPLLSKHLSDTGL